MAVTILAEDVLRGNLAQCTIVASGNRYNFMQAKDVECVVKKTIKEVQALGTTLDQFKATRGSGSGSGNFYFNTPIFHKMLAEFKATGKNIYFDMEMIITDPDSAANGMKCIIKRCLTTEDLIAKFNSNGDLLETKLEFNFGDYEIPELFKETSGHMFGN